MEKQRKKVWAIFTVLLITLITWCVAVGYSSMKREVEAPPIIFSPSMKKSTKERTNIKPSCLKSPASLLSRSENFENDESELAHYLEARRTHVLKSFTGVLDMFTMFDKDFVETFEGMNFGDIHSTENQTKYLNYINYDAIYNGAVLQEHQFNTTATSTIPAACNFNNQTAPCDNVDVPRFKQYISEEMNAGIMVKTRWKMNINQLRAFITPPVYLNVLYSPELSKACQAALWQL